MKSEFEKLPQIESHLHNVVFDEGSNEYLAKKMGHLPFEFSEWFVNGSWVMYQHQQSKVDELLTRLDERWNESWSSWKEKADMYEQGAANAFEEAYQLLEQAIKGGE